MNTDDNELPPELDALNELRKNLLTSVALLSLQMVDIQARVSALLDLYRDQLVNSGRSSQNAAEYIQRYLDLHQKAGQAQLQKQMSQILGESSIEGFDFDGLAH
jgi:hypothetical protein